MQLLQEGRVFVVLAEPGAGKTELLKKLAGLLKTTRIKASIFRNRAEDSATAPLVIDAMDEVARIDTIATDQIIAQAGDSSPSTMIFAGRSGEWDQGRTACVEQCFGVTPIIVRLEPFDEDEQRQLFTALFPEEDFETFTEEVRKFELGPLLGNPQFLQLLGEAYIESNRVFTSKVNIFADAMKRLAHEANPELGRQITRPETPKIVALGCEVFAKLMLSGATGVATVEQLSDRDFPYIGSLCRNVPEWTFLLDTRLLKPADDADKHEPNHRIVAEYCAARYFVNRIESPSDRLSLERVFTIIAPNRVTRDELRGMLGWIAALGREPLQCAAIRLDPYAVLANGDPGQLTATAKRMLLTKLEELSANDPMFRRSDSWRRFNVGKFFSADVLDQVRIILSKPSALRDLTLELLIDTDAALSLIPELTALMIASKVDGDTRKLALNVMLGTPAYDPADDLADLLAEGSPDALEIASRVLTKNGVSVVGVPYVSALLSKLSNLYPEPSEQHRDGASRYFIQQLVRSFNQNDVMAFLDVLSAGLMCTCSPKHDFLCTCRYGKSKIIGKLLDRYFELVPTGHDPARIWSWLKSLNFMNQVNADRSAAVKYLEQDHELRRSIQTLALAGIKGVEAARKALNALYVSRGHSGLHMRQGDQQNLTQFAFDNGLIDVWTALLCGHDIYGNIGGPNPTRALQRSQSKNSREFLFAWSRWEKSRRDFAKSERKEGRIHRRNRYAQREAAVEGRNHTHLRNNLAQIEAGQHWWWVQKFAQVYLYKPDELGEIADDPETPLRALRNCLPMLEPYIPVIGGPGRSDIAEALFAVCVLRYRDGESLRTLDTRVLAAAKAVISQHAVFADGEDQAFEDALDAVLFKPQGSAERFIRNHIERQLAATGDAPVDIYWLDQKTAFQALRKTLPLEWLERFPQMPLWAVHSLFNSAVKFGSREELFALIDRRLGDPVVDTGHDTAEDQLSRSRMKFWQVNAFLYNTPGGENAWNELKTDPQTIFALEHRLGRLFSQDGDAQPPLTGEQIFKILDAYVDVWPKVPLPSGWGTGDPEDERAYRFLRDCIWKIVDDKPAGRISALAQILADPKFTDFRDEALTLLAEANRQLAHKDFRAPHPTEINKLLDENDVASVEDLRALMAEELGEIQKWIDGSETDPLDAFYSGAKRVNENTARNRIVDKLQGRMTALGLSVEIERHMADGKRCDITASAIIGGANRLLVTEVKGQWNRELYTAASAQLDQRYAIHPDAAQQGVYLALWYGNGEKVAGLSNSTITSPAKLKESIISHMPEELRNRVDVVVLDLSRSPSVPKAQKAMSTDRHPKAV